MYFERFCWSVLRKTSVKQWIYGFIRLIWNFCEKVWDKSGSLPRGLCFGINLVCLFCVFQQNLEIRRSISIIVWRFYTKSGKLWSKVFLIHKCSVLWFSWILAKIRVFSENDIGAVSVSQFSVKTKKPCQSNIGLTLFWFSRFRKKTKKTFKRYLLALVQKNI